MPGNPRDMITMAERRFPVSPSELDVTVHENTLLVTGKAQKEEEKKNGNGYLHRGIARRAFERRLQPRRPHEGDRRQARQWHAPCRPGARGAGGGQAAQDRDRYE